MFAGCKFIRGISWGVFASSLLVAQNVAPLRPANTYHVPTSGPVDVVSPELHADRTVTFRIRAADAPDVKLALDGDHAMVKDANGIWSLTLGPFEPEIYEYGFRIGGARVTDPGNRFLKTGSFGASLLDVPGNPPRFDQVQDAPHGTLQIRSYTRLSRSNEVSTFTCRPNMIVSRCADFRYFIYGTEMVMTKRPGPLKGAQTQADGTQLLKMPRFQGAVLSHSLCG